MITDRVEGFHHFADWLAFGAEQGVIAHNDPVYQSVQPTAAPT